MMFSHHSHGGEGTTGPGFPASPPWHITWKPVAKNVEPCSLEPYLLYGFELLSAERVMFSLTFIQAINGTFKT